MLRRKEPLHERLAREGGLTEPIRAPHDTTPRWGETGIHGVARPRQWDVVVLVEAPALDGDEVHFVALPDGSLVVEEDVEADALGPLAEAVETSVRPPYRAEAVRRHENRFALAAEAIEFAEVPVDVAGDRVELTVLDGRRELRIDGERSFGSIRSLEQLVEERHNAYVLHAERLDGPFWEVQVAPL
jgi:hypothetical protein